MCMVHVLCVAKKKEGNTFINVKQKKNTKIKMTLCEIKKGLGTEDIEDTVKQHYQACQSLEIYIL